MAQAYKNEYSPEEVLEKLFQKGLLNTDGTSPYIQKIIEDNIEKQANQFFWQEHFTIDGAEVPIDPSRPRQAPAYTVNSLVKRVTPMADAHSPLSETNQMDNETFESRSGTIPQYAKGLYETSLTKGEYLSRLREMGITDNDVVSQFIRGAWDLVKSHNYRLSNMAAQVLSKGGAYSNSASKGITGVSHNFSSYILPENFKKAGLLAWTDADCDIPQQMRKIEQDFRAATGYEAPMEWDLPYDFVVSVMLNNAAVKKEIQRYINTYGTGNTTIVYSATGALPEASYATWQQLVEYSRSDLNIISPIRIVKESQRFQDLTTISTVKGWQSGVAVLRPLGFAGKVFHSKVADVMLLEKEANKTIDFSIGSIQGGLFYLVNKVVPNGLYKSYHTDLYGRFLPVLTEFTHHIVVDTTTAD